MAFSYGAASGAGGYGQPQNRMVFGQEDEDEFEDQYGDYYDSQDEDVTDESGALAEAQYRQ